MGGSKWAIEPLPCGGRKVGTDQRAVTPLNNYCSKQSMLAIHSLFYEACYIVWDNSNSFPHGSNMLTFSPVHSNRSPCPIKARLPGSIKNPCSLNRHQTA